MNWIKPLLLTVCLLFASQAWAKDLVFIADINGRYGSDSYHNRVSAAVDSIISRKPDWVISAGDLVAGQKQSLDDSALQRMWSGFDRDVHQPLRGAEISLLPTPGNHDGSALPGFSREVEAFNAYWKPYQPGQELLPGSDWPRRYAIISDDLLLVFVDGSRPGRLQEADLQLLESALRQKTPAQSHSILVTHLPLWPIAQGRESEILNDQRLLDLIRKYRVDFVVSGHHHAFYAGQDAQGTVHLALGALGGNARRRVGQEQRSSFSYTRLEFCNGRYRLITYRAPGFAETVDWADLPEGIEGPAGRLTRLDRVVPGVSAQCI